MDIPDNISINEAYYLYYNYGIAFDILEDKMILMEICLEVNEDG